MKKILFPVLVTLSALAVSGSAAFYSVYGLSKLFAGASTQVIIMAGSLEFAKLVVASLLYQYWDTINKVLRGYLLTACFVLMLITSGGIYGFLSGAYQTTATQSSLLDKSLMVLKQKQVRFQETNQDLTAEKIQLNTSISDLRVAISNPGQTQYVDKASGQIITSTSNAGRKALQKELAITITNRDDVNLKIEAIIDSIGRTDMAILDKEISNEASSELGPLKYLSETTGAPMGKVVNWFLLLIIFVFDPLAIALVVAANMAFAQIKKEEPKDDLKDYFSKRNMQIAKVVDEVKIKMEPQDITITNLESNSNQQIDMLEKEAEHRMNIIGQNGNDGLHYEIADTKSVEDKEDIYQERAETPTERVQRLRDEYTRMKDWGTKN
jgi:hypothetical protein